MARVPARIELSPDEMNAFIERVQSQTLTSEDYELVQAMAETILCLSQALEEKRGSIVRLLRMLFGVQTEKAKNILNKDESSVEESPQIAPPHPSHSAEDSPPPKGHGRNGSQSYTGAQKVQVEHCQLRTGDVCPLCLKGKVYPMPSAGKVVRVVGKAPLEATVFELEKLRCNLCGEIFTAKMPETASCDKYDETAGSMIALLKYGSGLPFYRLEKLQENLGMPLPASTQWDIVERVADLIYPAFDALLESAAQGQVLHNDDTTMKILSLINQINEEDPTRTGIFTTGILSILDEHKIALFFTGRRHAGENMERLLKERNSALGPPIQMCDALSRNLPKDLLTLVAHCLVHARRHFVEAYPSFPTECGYVIEMLAKVYRIDDIAKEQQLSAEERLILHQKESAPVMEELRAWCVEQFDKKLVEPNCGAGKAIKYLLRYWDKFTLFLTTPGAPLDNNLCEQALKRAVLHRKNALFFKTEHGAYIGDLFMSLIHTCRLNGVNPFEYLTALQLNSSRVRKKPGQWLPWNYHKNPAPNVQ